MTATLELPTEPAQENPTRPSGRLRFSVPTTGIEGVLRVIVLDESGALHARAQLPTRARRTQVTLRGFPRGNRFLVCAFADHNLIWSSPITSG